MSNLVSISILEQDVSGALLQSWSFPEFPQQSISLNYLQSTFFIDNSPFVKISESTLENSSETILVLISTNIFYIYFKSHGADFSRKHKILLLETKDYHLDKYKSLLKTIYENHVEPQHKEKIITPLNILSDFLTAFGKNRLKDLWNGVNGFSSPPEYKVELFQQELRNITPENHVNLWTAVSLKKKIVIRLDKSAQKDSYRLAHVANALNCYSWNRINNWNQFINIGSEESLSSHHIFGDFQNNQGYDLLITIHNENDRNVPTLSIQLHQSQIQVFEQTKHHKDVLQLFNDSKALDTELISKLNLFTKGILASLSQMDDLSLENLLEKSNQNVAYARFLNGLAIAENLNS